MALSHDERTYQQMLHVSADGGATWTKTPMDGWGLCRDIALSADGLRGIMVSSGQQQPVIRRTSDGGMTWQQPDPAVRLMPYWVYGAVALAAVFMLALPRVTRRKRTA